MITVDFVESGSISTVHSVDMEVIPQVGSLIELPLPGTTYVVNGVHYTLTDDWLKIASATIFVSKLIEYLARLDTISRQEFCFKFNLKSTLLDKLI